MKLKIILFLVSLFLLGDGSTRCENVINNLNWVEVSKKRFAPQVMLDFSHPIYFERSIDEEKMLLELAFPGMSLKAFKKDDVLLKFKELGDVIRDVQISYKKVPSPRVVLSIVFARKDILVRWNKMEDPNRLILDIFMKRSLKRLQHKNTGLLFAQNDVATNEAGKKLPDHLIKLGTPGNPSNEKKNLRILIDAGHGGKDSGASGFFLLKEKDIALDIARRTAFLLKKTGLKTFLTRSDDTDLTLLERNELANQLRADLFVSIHVNSLQREVAKGGMETYHLSEQGVIPSFRQGGFFFASEKNDKELTETADDFLINNINLSKTFASTIQDTVTSFLESKKISIENRGTKKAKFRILLRSEIPVALIEVGFLTNKKEAKKLASSVYRHMLAIGISKGIQKYLDLQN